MHGRLQKPQEGGMDHLHPEWRNCPAAASVLELSGSIALLAPCCLLDFTAAAACRWRPLRPA